MKKLIILFVCILNFKSHSCSCIDEFSEFSPIYLYEYNHIFSCRPFAIDTLEKTINYKVAVLKNYWGTEKDTFTIITARHSGGCGYHLEIGTQYLIYANGNDNDKTFHSCSPSRELSALKNIYTDNENPNDSVKIKINGSTKYYSLGYLKEYFNKSRIIEIEMLEKLMNLKNGNLQTIFSNDTVSGILSIKNGKLDGLSVFYFPNGKIKTKGNFKENLKEGLWHDNIYKEIRQVPYYFVTTGKYKDNHKIGTWKGKMIIGNFDDFTFYTHQKKKQKF